MYATKLVVARLNWYPKYAQGQVTLTYLLSYLPTPWSRVLLEKITDFQRVKKFSAFYRTRRFFTAFTNARRLSLSWARSIHNPTSKFLKIHLNIILPSTPGSPKWYLHLRFPHKNPVYASPLPHTRYVPRLSQYSRFDHSNNIGWGAEIIKLLIMKFSPLPCYLVPLRPKHSPQHPVLKHP